MTNPHCPNCNFEVSSEAIFCPNCGWNLSEELSKEIPMNEEISEEIPLGICAKCGTSHSPPIPSHCEACGHPLSESKGTVESFEGKQERTPVEVLKPEKRAGIKLPEIRIGQFRKVFPIVLGVAIIGVLGVFGWNWWQGRGTGGVEVAACKPIEPGDDFEEANQRNISGEFRQNAYFKSGVEYTIDHIKL